MIKRHYIFLVEIKGVIAKSPFSWLRTGSSDVAILASVMPDSIRHL